MTPESDDVFAKVFGGNPSDTKCRHSLQSFFERRPFMPKLADDDRIHGIAERLLGDDFVLNATEGNFHFEDTQWHGSNGKPIVVRSIKIAFYLEPLTKGTGCLRFMPGSHCPGFIQKLVDLSQQPDDPDEMPFGVPGSVLPCVAVESEPGESSSS